MGAPVVRRAAWGLADQAVSSLTNFLVGIIIARSVDLVDFGSFSLAFVAYTVCLNAGRALGTTPLLVRYSGAQGPAWHAALRASTGMALIVGVATGAICICIGLVVGGALQEAFLAMGVVMPGLLLQDAWRFAFFAQGRGPLAFINDSIWAVVIVPAFIVALVIHTAPVLWLTLAWGAAAAVAAAAGIVQARATPAPQAALGWLREHRDLAPRYLAEFMTQSGVSQLALTLIGVIAGLAAVGAIRAGQLLLGPLNIMFMGAELVAVPEAVKLAQRSTRQMRRAVTALGIFEGGVSLAWGGLLIILPAALGTLLLRDNWPAAQLVLLPLTVWLAASGLQEAGIVGLRGIAAADLSLRARLIGSGVYLFGAILGALQGGVVGASWGIAIASAANVGLWWLALRAGVRRTGPQMESPGRSEPGIHSAA